MKVELELLPVMMPNFLPVKGWAERRISVVELSYEEAEKYGELMKQEFIKHHHEKKKRQAADKIKIAYTL
jgi:hypothetical protein